MLQEHEGYQVGLGIVANTLGLWSTCFSLGDMTDSLNDRVPYRNSLCFSEKTQSLAYVCCSCLEGRKKREVCRKHAKGCEEKGHRGRQSAQGKPISLKVTRTWRGRGGFFSGMPTAPRWTRSPSSARLPFVGGGFPY